jgi:CRISPR/Cas system endoribonuclease Cas6 (RAMP superfamily)
MFYLTNENLNDAFDLISVNKLKLTRWSIDLLITKDWWGHFNFLNIRVHQDSRIQKFQFLEFTTLTYRIHIHVFTSSALWIQAFKFLKRKFWIREVEILKFRTWIDEVEFIKFSWIRVVEIWIREVEIVKSWRWNRKFVKLKWQIPYVGNVNWLNHNCGFHEDEIGNLWSWNVPTGLSYTMLPSVIN